MVKKNSIKLFGDDKIRAIWDDEQEKWYFSIVDVIAVLTESPNPQTYWRVLKKRLKDEGNETVTNCNALKMRAADGKMRLTDVADTEQLLRIIQSVPSPKAEPFKMWLAKVGAEQTEGSLFDLLGYTEEEVDDPNAKIEQVRKVFTAINSGSLKTSLEDRFYILGLAPNSARIAVVYWSECSLKEFAGKILCHFKDMEIKDTRIDKKPYMGIKSMLAAVTLNGKQSEATPNLPEAVVKSIFQGTPYPFTLFSACIRRIRAESGSKDAIRIARIAIIKAYLNRTNSNNKKIEIMLDKSNTNQGYLCGRLFAVLDKIQVDANGGSSIRERYMNAASATPASVFATILNLSSHHMEKLSNQRKKIFLEKMKQEIMDKIPATGFPAHLDLQDQGRFFIGYYHQRQEFFTKKEEENKD